MVIFMGKFTLHSNKSIDYSIEAKILKICQYLKKNLQNSQLISIYLIGGFGRGEGSLLILNDNDFRLLKDFDFLLVFNDKVPNPNLIRIVKKEILNRYLEIMTEDVFFLHNFTIDINVTTIQNLSLYFHSSVASYEFKYSSKLIYGVDIRNKMKIIKKDFFPISSSFHFLFQKLIGLIGHLNTDKLIFNNWDINSNLNFVMELYKTYIEIGTCLSILVKCYEPSFYARAENLIMNKDKLQLLFEIQKIIPDLFEKIQFSTYQKLKPNQKKFPEDLKSFFIEVKEDLILVIEFLIKKYFKLDLVKNPLFFLSNEFDGYWDFFILSNLYLKSKFLAKFTQYLKLPIYFDRYFLKLYLINNFKIKKNNKFIKLYFPNLLIYNLGYLLLKNFNFNLKQKDLIDFNRIYEKFIGSVSSEVFKNMNEEWEKARKLFIILDSKYYGLR